MDGQVVYGRSMKQTKNSKANNDCGIFIIRTEFSLISYSLMI